MKTPRFVMYPFMDDSEVLSFETSDNKEVDSHKYSLYEVIGDNRLTNLRISDRAKLLQSWLNDSLNKNCAHHDRISYSGCNVEKDVLCPYTGKVSSMLNFASNDYLNMSQHPTVINAAKEALDQYGAGSGAASVSGGRFKVTADLEKELAQTFCTEEALVYSSGYNTNVGVLGALLKENDVAIIDMYSHASIIDGGMQSNALFFIHNNLHSLESQLKKATKLYKNKIVAVDAVYSMDGDIAPLPEIVELCKKYNAWLMVDDAHGFGVLGKNGCGVIEHFGLEGKVDLVVGTLSKSVGTVGGFIAAKKEIINYLRFASRPHFFTTAPFVSANAAALASIRIIKEDAERRNKLQDNIAYVKKRLLDSKFNILKTTTAIFPIITGSSHLAFEAAYKLHKADILVSPVPYPAVPRKLARVRMTLSAGFSKAQLNKGLEEIIRVGKELTIIP